MKNMPKLQKWAKAPVLWCFWCPPLYIYAYILIYTFTYIAKIVPIFKATDASVMNN